MSNIFNIAAEELQIINELEENGGELTPELEERLALNETATDEKIASYREVLAQLKSEHETIDTEIKRLQALKKSKGTLLEKIKGNLLWWMQATDRKSYKGATFSMSVRSTQSVEVLDEAVDTLPDDLVRIKREANKTAIGDLLKAGETIEGCQLVTKQSITIR